MTTRVLFVCVSNRGKSVMAEGLARLGAYGAIEASSAGTQAAVGGTVNELSAQVLAEVGGDISNHQPRQLTNDMMTTADLVIAVGTAAQIDAPTGTVVEVWDTDEPSLRGFDGLDRMRLIRNDIAARVDDLAHRLTHEQSR
ncbi:MAG TPA: low molecular weight phosphatase family protein [Gordonia sp. (in: high G+C Gram-positive bacteria)]|jgi:arsenate-mycothiol transferase|uniref:arsenate-mycothiol transferase ArsC n=1 Tax=unclassified Gordonia (in: high G+C Gram-positive bacteria) TaxID=2657482 RepID=UPI000FAB9B74|nr:MULTISPECIES: low molecular weight phosphatase family protein [unclassified Gordonia (in: high G+C Gram-positive bacteria)]RUP38938.1 MAG: low molecular weight phosphatase family protein [Gordonia sp. (in: high G+C Gram-positive bacteria)]HNP56453.1 low molecular weight phosphatase family protein [Gordonia sp. (in: high G+C Gram-positive bacteria)]HRC50794.1 low molecular weight phosphatase family protein [Gordonia sp. (in: high G+C Gram-positive bacteria)]